MIWWNGRPDSRTDLDATINAITTPELHAFLDAKLTDLTASLSRNRQAMAWLQDRAMDDASLLGIVGTALAAIRQQEHSLAEIQQRLSDEPSGRLPRR